MDYYEFVRGPLAMVAFTIFVLGTCYRLIRLASIGNNPKMLYPKDAISGSLRSIGHHLLPFAARYMRARPVFTIVTGLFHLAVIAVPLFLLAHIILWFESYGLEWWSIPDGLADGLTVFVLAACIFFFVRRLTVPEVRQVSGLGDYGLLIAIFISFLTGFLAFHQWGPYRPMLILHILSSEILIIIIPFSRLMHMLFFVFSRSYMGAEHGRVMGSSDW
jgi:nitrate reductase gamma subunit